MNRQDVINLVYRNFADAGDDETNCDARLTLLGITTQEVAVASEAYGDDESSVKARNLEPFV